MGILEGKRALIVGVASNKSIAWGVAKAMHREGAELAFTYQGERLRSRVEDFAAECGSEITVPCDVASDEEIQNVFDHLDNYWEHVDIMVHSIAYAPREELRGEYLDSVTRDGFRVAHEISSFSFAALGNAARPLMQGVNATKNRVRPLHVSRLGDESALPSARSTTRAVPAQVPSVFHSSFPVEGP